MQKRNQSKPFSWMSASLVLHVGAIALVVVATSTDALKLLQEGNTDIGDFIEAINKKGNDVIDQTEFTVIEMTDSTPPAEEPVAETPEIETPEVETAEIKVPVTKPAATKPIAKAKVAKLLPPKETAPVEEPDIDLAPHPDHLSEDGLEVTEKILDKEDEALAEINDDQQKVKEELDDEQLKADSEQETETVAAVASEEQVSEVEDNSPAPSTEPKNSESIADTLPQKQVAATAASAFASTAGSIDAIQDARKLVQAPGNRPPRYPVKARLSGKEGTVTLSYYVTSNGGVRDIRVLQSSGIQSIDQEAVRAVQKYKYVPGQEGQAIHPLEFRLKGPKAKLPSRLRTS